MARAAGQSINRPRVCESRLAASFWAGNCGTPSDFATWANCRRIPSFWIGWRDIFVEHNWSTKEMHRLILTSATYRQSAVVSGHVARSASTIDPENRLLWRQNVRRLESDQIRDAMLQASGELDQKAGGPSVEASQTTPDDLYEMASQ